MLAAGCYTGPMPLFTNRQSPIPEDPFEGTPNMKNGARIWSGHVNPAQSVKTSAAVSAELDPISRL